MTKKDLPTTNAKLLERLEARDRPEHAGSKPLYRRVPDTVVTNVTKPQSKDAIIAELRASLAQLEAITSLTSNSE